MKMHSFTDLLRVIVLLCMAAIFLKVYGGVVLAEENDSTSQDIELINNIEQFSENWCDEDDSSRFQSCRLIVSGTLPEDHGAFQVITDNSGEYILFFETPKETRTAYRYLIETLGEENVQVDELFDADDILMGTSGGILSWGIATMGFDKLKKERFLFSETVTVAIIDSGLTDVDSIFDKRIDTSRAFDFTSSDSGYYDAIGHGTAVSGIIAEATPDNIKLMPLKVFRDDGTTSAALIKMAIQYAIDHDTDIINMSLSIQSEINTYTVWDQVLEAAYEAGIPVICSAGNKVLDIKYSYPASRKDTISVTSIGPDMTFDYDCSAYGKEVDFCAPGKEIRTYAESGIKVQSGTSFAAPHITAAAAYLLSAEKSKSVDSIKTCLTTCCDDLGDAGKDSLYGNGLPRIDRFFYGEEETIEESEASSVEVSKQETTIEEAVTDKTETESSTESAPEKETLSLTESSEMVKETEIEESSEQAALKEPEQSLEGVTQTDSQAGKSETNVRLSETQATKKTESTQTDQTEKDQNKSTTSLEENSETSAKNGDRIDDSISGNKIETITERQNTGKTAEKTNLPKAIKLKNVKSGVSITWKNSKKKKVYIYRRAGSGQWKYIKKSRKSSFTDKKVKAGKKYTYLVQTIKRKPAPKMQRAKTIIFLKMPVISKPVYRKEKIRLAIRKLKKGQRVQFQLSSDRLFSKTRKIKTRKTYAVFKIKKARKKWYVRARLMYKSYYSAWSRSRVVRVYD